MRNQHYIGVQEHIYFISLSLYIPDYKKEVKTVDIEASSVAFMVPVHACGNIITFLRDQL